MAFLRAVFNWTTAIAATALPAALALNSLSSYSSSSAPSSRLSKKLVIFSSLSSGAFLRADRFASRPSALHMEAPAPSSDLSTFSQNDADLPELLTEFMVDMHCDGCVKAVKDKLQTVNGVKNVTVDLSNQVVRILGSSPVKILAEALELTGRKARLIGQGVPEEFSISAAVAEFKGPKVFGVVRLAQVRMELAAIEANLSGLSPGKHGWSINEYGDLTRGAASTGKVFNPSNQTSNEELLGDLGTLDVDSNGEVFFSGFMRDLRVADLIGRAVAVYETADRSDPGLSAAVIARSAGVGENYKKLCTCDGTTIWEATNADFVASKV